MSTNISNLKNGQTGATAGFPAMLKKFQSEIARALPRHISGDRMARIALTEFRKNPALGKCDPKSVFAAVVQASQLGLEPGIVGQAYLIPYGTECQLVPGWMGLNDLVARSGRASTWTGAVFEGDEFEFALGDRPFLTHRPCGEDLPERLTHVYAIGRVKEAEWPIIEVWSVEKARRHRDRYNKVGKRHYSFRHFEMYARKIALLQVLKYMPKSIEISTAMELERASDSGEQGLNVPDAIHGTWARVEVPETAEGLNGAAETEKPQAPSNDGEKINTAAPTAETWPQQLPDEETGELRWADSAGHFFDPNLHGMSADRKTPSVTAAGVFRARRGAAKPHEVPNPAQSGAPAQGKDQSPPQPEAGDPGFGDLE